MLIQQQIVSGQERQICTILYICKIIWSCLWVIDKKKIFNMRGERAHRAPILAEEQLPGDGLVEKESLFFKGVATNKSGH